MDDSNTIEEQVSFKVTLLQQSAETFESEFVDLFDKIAVRRFNLPKYRSTSVEYLRHTIMAQFGDQLTKIFDRLETSVILKIHWKDKDGDFVKIDSDSELLIGLHENKEVFNLAVVAGPGNLVVTEENAANLSHIH